MEHKYPENPSLFIPNEKGEWTERYIGGCDPSSTDGSTIHILRDIGIRLPDPIEYEVVDKDGNIVELNKQIIRKIKNRRTGRIELSEYGRK